MGFANDLLFYPGYPVKELKIENSTAKVYVQIVDDSFNKVMNYFLKLPQGSDLESCFPQ